MITEPDLGATSISEPRRTLRVLHVVGGLDRGGIETWLARVVDAHGSGLDVHIAVIMPPPWPMEPMFRGRASLHRLQRTRSLFGFARNLWSLLKNLHPVDVVHSHVSFLSGVVVATAAVRGVPVRIAHSHTDKRGHERPSLFRQGYAALMRQLIRLASSHVAGSSNEAIAHLVGAADKANATRRVVLPLAVDQRADVPPKVRKEPRHVLTLGHVGRFIQAKNHVKLIQIAVELASQSVDFELVLVGDGPLLLEIEDLVKSSELEDRVRFLGERDDVAILLARDFDVFVFPSRYEGFGLAALEAQAAGLPCVVSRHLPDALTVIPELVTRVDEESPPECWVDAIVAASNADRLPLDDVRTRIANSPYAIGSSVDALQRIYRGERLHPTRKR